MSAARLLTVDLVLPSADGPRAGRVSCDRRPVLEAVLVALWTLGALAVGWVATAQAQAPSVVYDEDFENGVAATPVILTAYTGATGQTYTAAPAWLTGCNGSVLQFNSPNAGQAAAGCAQLINYSGVRQLAYALGVHGGSATPATNHAVTAYTEGNPGANLVEFATVGQVPVPSNGRFLTFRVDTAAVNCPPQASAPLYQFSLINGASATPVGGVINACTSTSTVTVPAVGNRPATVARVGTYTSNGSLLFTGPSVGIRMVNTNGSGAGNDAAFDNITILDATPRLAKSFSPAALNAGGTSTLTFTIANTSELAAKNGWSLTDTLPAGLAVASPAAASTTCGAGQVTAVAGGGSVAVSGNLNAGQASCTASVNVTSSIARTYTNGPDNMTRTGLEAPPPSTVQFQSADLAIVKSASPDTITPGENVTYTLEVTNHGPDPAVAVRVSDPLPSGLTFVSASPGCSAAAADVTCAVGTLAAGASQTFTVTSSVASSVTGRLTNTATVDSVTADPDPGDNTSTVTVPSEGVADLSITKVASTSTVGPGGQVLYTLVVENDGPSNATGVVVTDAPPAGLVAQSANPAQGTCAIAGGRVSCSLGDLASGGSTQVLVTAQGAAGASGSLTNTTTVIGDQRDPDPSDNTGTAMVTVPSPPVQARAQPRADLSVTKRAARSTVTVGQRLTYTIVVTNNGPAAAQAAKLTDTLNRRAAVVSVSTTAGSCTKSIPFTCSLGTIESGASVTITAVIKPRRSGRARNAAGATSSGFDANPDNNLDTVDVGVRKVALRLSKVAGSSSVPAGETLGYRIRVRNPTKGEARNVRVCDRLPSGLAYVSSKPQARRGGRRRCWTIKSLKAGKSRTFRITVRTARGANGRKVNRAVLSSRDSKRVRAKDPIQVLGVATPVTG
jgi:uncharacterized repeat protein (TIGR01451 family)